MHAAHGCKNVTIAAIRDQIANTHSFNSNEPFFDTCKCSISVDVSAVASVFAIPHLMMFAACASVVSRVVREVSIQNCRRVVVVSV